MSSNFDDDDEVLLFDVVYNLETSLGSGLGNAQLRVFEMFVNKL